MGDWAVTAQGLTRRFGATTAVDGVDLRVPHGGIYGFLGRNGAGKTTVIRMLLGLIRPTAGRVTVLDVPVGARRTGQPAPWDRVGYLLEAPALYPELTIREHLRVAARYRGIGAGPVTDALEQFGLGRGAETKARALSLGNRQRLGLALALMHRPELVILDEPSNGLDPAGVVEMRSRLRELADDGVTVFMSSHHIAEVSRLADRIGIIHQGRLVEELEADQLRNAARRRLAMSFTDSATAVQAAAILQRAGLDAEVQGDSVTSADDRSVTRPEHVATLLVEALAPPRYLAVEQEDLEDHFLRMTGTVPA
jgi:ABC-2 type transport system ATP-binding protein